MRPTIISLLLLGGGLAACEPAPAPQYVYGTPLGDLEFELYSPNMGIYPDSSVLADPNNPFRGGIAGDGPVRFAALDAGPVTGFYAFATALAIIPFGENQYYAANQLHEIHDGALVPAEELAIVRSMAIRGYQQVLDEFEDTAFTFDPTGRLVFDLMPLAVQGIQDLGGTPANGWRLATGPDGETIAVQSGGNP